MLPRPSQGLPLALALALGLGLAACAPAGADDAAASSEGDVTAGAAASLAHDYEGTIGDLAVLVRLDAQGANVTGSYFYSEKTGHGDDLILEGSTEGGTITLTERVNGTGAPTGTFTGHVAENGRTITGTWETGGRTLPLRLEAITSLKTATRKFQDCSVEAELVEIYGLADARAERAMMDALAVERTPCDGEYRRTVTQSVAYEANGFLTIEGGIGYLGGAYPSFEARTFNFFVPTGAALGASDVFTSTASAPLKALVEERIEAEPDLSDEDKKDRIEELERRWPDDAELGTLMIAIGADGITINMANDYPHAMKALAPIVTIPWSEVAPLVAAESPVATLALSR